MTSMRSSCSIFWSRCREQFELDVFFRSICEKVLGSNRKFTGRSTRPTAFCIDTFKGAGDASLQIASRSSGQGNVARYSRGARALQCLSLETVPIETQALLGTFKQPIFENENMVLAVLGSENVLSFEEILQRFVCSVPSSLSDIESYARYFTGELFVESANDIRRSFKRLASEMEETLSLDDFESI